MTIEEAVRTRLLAISPVSALVSTRVWMFKLPQKPTLPAIRIQKISNVTHQHARGPVAQQTARIQVDAYDSELNVSDPYASTTVLARAVHGDGLGPSATGLFGWIGVIASGGEFIRMKAVRRVMDGPSEYEGGELRLVVNRQDYVIDWEYLT